MFFKTPKVHKTIFDYSKIKDICSTKDIIGKVDNRRLRADICDVKLTRD